MKNSDLHYDCIVTSKIVLCGCCALVRNGLISWDGGLHLDMYTEIESLHKFNMVYAMYFYTKKIDYEYCVSPSSTNPLILVPTKERALIEYIRDDYLCDEGILIEALKSYLMWFRNDELLKEAAEHFGVAWETVLYWIHEAETDEEI